MREALSELLGVMWCAVVGHDGALVGRHRLRPVWVYQCRRCGASWEDEG